MNFLTNTMENFVVNLDTEDRSDELTSILLLEGKPKAVCCRFITFLIEPHWFHCEFVYGCVGITFKVKGQTLKLFWQ